MNKTRAIYFWIAKIGIVVLAIIGIVCLVWYNEPAPSVSYERRVLTSDVAPGQMFKITNRVHRTKSCYTKIHREIVDNAGRIMEFERDWTKRETGWDRVEFEAEIPADVAIGPARLEVVVWWYCNPIQKRWPSSEAQETIRFNIVPIENVKR